MAQSSVAREPSMEEILASIRRIIESNDPVSEGQAMAGARNRTVEDPAQDFDEDDIELDAELEAPFVAQVAANDPGGRFVPSSESLPLRPTIDPAMRQRFAEEAGLSTDKAPERTLSLADVAARVRAAAGRVPEPVAARAAPQPQPTAPEAAAESRPVSAPRAAAEEMRTEMRPEPQLREGARAVQIAEFDEQRATVATPAVEARAAAAESLPARIEEQVALLSDEAGQRVARSFNELADIFNGIERQLVEDMAREMLQPMLREWLDDNLPTLVERLVREEIERVARGPRR